MFIVPRIILSPVITFALIASFDSSSVLLERKLASLETEVKRYPGQSGPLFKLGQFYRYEYNCSLPTSRFKDCLEPALDCYLQVREIVMKTKFADFDYPGSLNDLGVMLASVGQLNAARDVYLEAIALSPTLVSSLANLAGLESTYGSLEEADNLYARAVEVAGSSSPALLYNYGVFKFKVNKLQDAESLWRLSLQLDPDMYLSYGNLATLKCTEGLYEESLALYKRAVAMAEKKGDASAMWSLILQLQTSTVPVITPIPTPSESVAVGAVVKDIRRRYIEGLEQVIRHAPPSILDDASQSVGCSSIGYYLIYHGHEDFYVRQLHAAAYWQMAQKTLRFHRNNEEQEEKHMLGGNQKSENISARIRVGFLSGFFRHHSVGLLLRGVISRLDRTRFHVSVITVNQGVSMRDYLTDELERVANMHHITGSLDQMRPQIRSLHLDVLVIGEIGMDIWNYLLSFGHLARRSVVFWGHAVTSGITGIDVISKRMRRRDKYDPEAEEGDTKGATVGPDYFLSSVLFEGVDCRRSSTVCPCESSAVAEACSNCLRQQKERVRYSQLEYSERLILMDGLVSCFERPPQPLSLRELNLTLGDPTTFDYSVTQYVQSEVTASRSEGGHIKLLQEGYGRSRNMPDWLATLPSKRQFLLYLSPDLVHILPPAAGVRQQEDDASFHLYGIPQTLYKLHPDFDALIAGVLQADPRGVAVFPRGQNAVWSQQVLHRLSQRFAALHNVNVTDLLRRVVFVRNMSEKEYLTLVAVSDVLLDPFPVGGGRSSLESFSVGTPIVFMRPRTSILQLTYGMYAAMGIGLNSPRCCAAYSQEEYIAMAVGVAGDATYNHVLRSEILDRGRYLFENASVVQEWEKMLTFIAAAPRPVPRAVTTAEIDWEDFGTCFSGSRESDAHTATGRAAAASVAASRPTAVENASAHWLQEEFDSVFFTHPRPPILLRDIFITASLDCNKAPADFVVYSTPNACIAAPPEYVCDLSVAAMCDVIPVTSLSSKRDISNSYNDDDAGGKGALLFSASFTQQSRDGTVTTFPITVPSKENDGGSTGVEIVKTDWREVCAATVARYGIDDKLKILYICSIVGKGVGRTREAVYQRFSFTFEGHTFDLDVHMGEDLGVLELMILNGYDTISRGFEGGAALGHRPVLSPETVSEIFYEIESMMGSSDLLGSASWIEKRQAIIRNWISWAQVPTNISDTKSALRSRPINGLDLLSPGCFVSPPAKTLQPQPQSVSDRKIVVGITTCRRLWHFCATADALLSAFETLPNSLISDVIVVDDNSSLEDRMVMLQRYPYFQFIWKGGQPPVPKPIHQVHFITGAQTGHAASLNILVDTFLARRSARKHYFFYLEDDWRMLDVPIIHAALGRGIDAIGRSLGNQVDESEPRHALRNILVASMHILGGAGGDDGEHVHQVLLNEQSHRECALGNVVTCDLDTIGRGGWPRSTSFFSFDHDSIVRQDGDATGANSSVIARIPFSLHEFGIVPQKSLTKESNRPHRQHEFSYWPGLSLNPGLWDLDEIYRRAIDCIHPDVHLARGKRFIFSEDDHLFEHRFSSLGVAANLTMAYLPALLFEHIGNISAYTLNNLKRPWDV